MIAIGGSSGGQGTGGCMSDPQRLSRWATMALIFWCQLQSIKS